jgi:hypothetical protein
MMINSLDTVLAPRNLLANSYTLPLNGFHGAEQSPGLYFRKMNSTFETDKYILIIQLGVKGIFIQK